MKIVLVLVAAGIVAVVPASALTSPRHVAFNYGLTTSHPDVVTVAPDGSDLRNLTPGEQTFYTADMNPHWSPDGTQIAFDSHRDSNVSTEIYLMDAGGSGQRRLTHNSGQGGIFNTVGPGASETVTVEGSRPTAGPIRLESQVFSNELDTDPTNNSASTGADVLPCTYASDNIYGTNGRDTICGLPGADSIYAEGGNDFIDAGNG